VSDGERIVLVLLLDMGWAGYCGVLSHVFNQPRKADAIATALGVVIVVVGMIR
jgi:hypothetical protein